MCVCVLGVCVCVCVCVCVYNKEEKQKINKKQPNELFIILHLILANSHIIFRFSQGSGIPYQTVTCVFNHNSFYANNQASDAVNKCNWNVHDKILWKPFNKKAIESLPR